MCDPGLDAGLRKKIATKDIETMDKFANGLENGIMSR